jgi:hypothetical protein
LALNHELGCRKLIEGTWRRIPGYRTAIKLDLRQNFSSKNRDKKMTTTDRVSCWDMFIYFVAKEFNR